MSRGASTDAHIEVLAGTRPRVADDVPAHHDGPNARGIVVSILIGLAVAVGSCAAKDASDRVFAIDRELRPRLSTLEAEVRGNTQRLDRIERKIDELLIAERRR